MLNGENEGMAEIQSRTILKVRSRITDAIKKLSATTPLVQNITNFVAMEISANVLLAVHASPLMAHAPEELEDIARIASALVINIGTLDEISVGYMEHAGRIMKKLGKPVTFDPVGAGASHYRTETALRFIDTLRPDIVRGNASEIMALGNAVLQKENPEDCFAMESRGVDSLNDSKDALQAANLLARRFSLTVNISGVTDYITDGEITLSVIGGNAVMPFITGMGCSASALNAACSACAEPLIASAAASAIMAEAGDQAGNQCKGPGTFLPAFLDELYNLNAENAANRVSVLR